VCVCACVCEVCDNDSLPAKHHAVLHVFLDEISEKSMHDATSIPAEIGVMYLFLARHLFLENSSRYRFTTPLQTPLLPSFLTYNIYMSMHICGCWRVGEVKCVCLSS